MALSTLARLGFDEPEAAADDLKRLGAWPPAAAPGGARLLADIAASAAPQLAARSLAALAAAHPDPDGFTAQLRRRLGFRRRLVPLVAASRSLGAWLATHPTEADRLADGRRFAAPRPRDELVAEAVATVTGHGADPAAAWDALRRFKRRELLRVAVRDLAGQVLVDEVAAELADLADACLEAALVVATGESGYDPPPMRMAVLGMGKLGGSELNYVSDIDVLFCHEPVAGAEPEAAARAADRVARGVMRGLSAVTPEGTCFEVDANLRPEGRNGPLSRTLGSYLAYWDRWAQPWERQALIKVRPAAGDAALAERFVEEATQRVYPERLDPETVPAVRRMKARVETSAKARAGGDRQVKLGPGGLRDVEFAVQLLQLVHGRHDPGLRSGSTLVALDRLTAAGFVGRADAAQLAEAYRFLRLVEHRLQLASERRTHTIPAGRGGAALAGPHPRLPGRAAGRAPWSGSRPTGAATPWPSAASTRSCSTGRCWRRSGRSRPALDPEGASERLAALGFANPGAGDGVAAGPHLGAVAAGHAHAGHAAGDAALAGRGPRPRRRAGRAAGAGRGAWRPGRVLRDGPRQPGRGRAALHRARHLAAARRAAGPPPRAAHGHGRPAPAGRHPGPGRAGRLGDGDRDQALGGGGGLGRAAPVQAPRAGPGGRARPHRRPPGRARRDRAVGASPRPAWRPGC